MKTLSITLFSLLSTGLFAQQITVTSAGDTYTFTMFRSGTMAGLPAGMDLPGNTRSLVQLMAEDGDKTLQLMFNASELKGKKAPFSLKIMSLQFSSDRNDPKKAMQIPKADASIKVSEYDETAHTFSGILEDQIQPMVGNRIVGFVGFKKQKAVVVFEKVKF